MAQPITAVPFYLEMQQNDQTTNPPNDKTTNPPNDKTTNPLFRNSIIGQSREKVFAVTKLQQEVT